jgi:hypothetical protein
LANAVLQAQRVSTTNKEFNHGPRNSSLAAGCSTSYHSSARHVLAPLAKENLVADVIYSGTDIASGESAPHSGKSAASWPAIIAGAFVAAGSSLILLALGSGFGFAVVSPWADHGTSAATFAVTAVIWLIMTQWISAALGGYIAGRLRIRWIGTHTHEVFFRDTAHGLVTWAVATVAVAALIGSSASSILGAGVRMSAASGSPPAASYAVDKLFRPAHATNAGQGADDPRPEAFRIMASSLASGGIPDADRTYLAEMVAAKTGISRADAQLRVDDWVSSADSARKAAAQVSIYTALSLLIGAFIACVSAALGGRLRDEHP